MKVTIEIPQDGVDLIEASGRKADTWALRIVYDAYLSLVRADAEDEADADKQRRVLVKVGRSIDAWDPLTEVTLTPPAPPA